MRIATSELLRRIGQVLPRGGIEPGDLRKARNDGAQPFGARREIALHQGIDGVARQARVQHRIALPAAHHGQLEQRRPDAVVDQLRVDRVVEGEPAAIDRGQAGLEGLEIRELRLDAVAREIFQLVVVLVEPDPGGASRGIGEPGCEVVVDERGEIRRGGGTIRRFCVRAGEGEEKGCHTPGRVHAQDSSATRCGLIGEKTRC